MLGTRQGRIQRPRLSQRRNPWIGLNELVRKVEHHYHQLLRETNLRGRRKIKGPGVRVDSRQRAAINQWMQGVKSKTPWEVNCMVYAAASILRPQKSHKSEVQAQGRKENCLRFRWLKAWLNVEITRQKQNAKATSRQRWIRRQLRREFHTLDLKCLVSNHEQTLGKLRVWKTQEKRKRVQCEFVEVNNLWVAQRKFLLDRPHLPRDEPEKGCLEEFWAGILEVNGQVNESDTDVKGWKEEVEASLGDLQPEEKLCLDEAWFRKILKKLKSWSAPRPDGIVNSWWKVFPEAEHALRSVTEEMLNAAIPFPDWLVTGRTVLIPKKGEAKDPGNYRSIACLNTQYKFAMAVLADSLAAQVEANGVLPEEHRALRKRGQRLHGLSGSWQSGNHWCPLQGTQDSECGLDRFWESLRQSPPWMAYLGAGHDPCTGMGESHSRSPSFNVEDSNGGEECATDCKN